jgi:hypothetical protein
MSVRRSRGDRRRITVRVLSDKVREINGFTQDSIAGCRGSSRNTVGKSLRRLQTSWSKPPQVVAEEAKRLQEDSDKG